MKKNKFMLVLFVTIISFCFGFNYVKALPTCDFDNYGTFELRTQKEVNSGDWTTSGIEFYETSTNTKIEYGASTTPESCNDLSLGEYGCWKTGEQKWYTVYAFDGGYINTAKFTVITENDDSSFTNYTGKSQCEYTVDVKKLCEETEGQTCETFKFMFTLNKKNIKFIKFEGTYYDASGNGPIDFDYRTLLVNKAGSDGAGVDHTTIAGKPIQQPIQKHIDSGSEIGADAGIGKATATKSKVDATINGETACNSINDMFDYFWPYVMIIIPILLILMMSIDFFKSMISNDAEAIKKAGSGAVKRTIAAVVLLALPVILRYIFELFGLDFCL